MFWSNFLFLILIKRESKMKKVIIHFPVYFLLTVLFILSSCTENEDIYNFVPPQLNVDKNTLTFGAQTESLIFNIENSGSGTLNWNASEDKSWLDVSPKSGSTTTSEEISITVDRDGLSDGDYSAQINVTSDWGNETINVTMGVVATDEWLIHDDDSFESEITVGSTGWLWVRFSRPSGWNSTSVTKVKVYVNSGSSYDFDIDCWDDYDYQQIGTNYWYTPSGTFINLESHISQSTGWYAHTVSHTFQSNEFFIGLYCWDADGPYLGVDLHDSTIKVAGANVSGSGVVVLGAIWSIRVYAEQGGCNSGEDIAIQKDKGKWLVPSPGIKQVNNKKIEIIKAGEAEQEIIYEYDIQQIFKNKIKIQGTLLEHSSSNLKKLNEIYDKIIMLDENR